MHNNMCVYIYICINIYIYIYVTCATNAYHMHIYLREGPRFRATAVRSVRRTPDNWAESGSRCPRLRSSRGGGVTLPGLV